MTNSLSAKVKAVNRVNAYIAREGAAILEALKPFIGQKILLATGGVAHKVVKVLDDIEAKAKVAGLTVYLYPSQYSFILTFKGHESCEGYSCVYHEQSLYLLKLDSATGFATETFDFNSENFPHSYTEAGIRELRAKLREAEDKVSSIKSALSNFFNH